MASSTGASSTFWLQHVLLNRLQHSLIGHVHEDGEPIAAYGVSALAVVAAYIGQFPSAPADALEADGSLFTSSRR